MQTISLSGPSRVLVLVDQPLVAETITLTLNHGAYVTREAKIVTAAAVMIEDWHPHLAVIDVDLGGELLVRLERSGSGGGATCGPS